MIIIEQDNYYNLWRPLPNRSAKKFSY